MSNEKLLINDDKSNNSEIKSNNEIEKMARTLCGIYAGDGKCECECPCDFDCWAYRSAKHLYEQGFRKQREGEWIITMPITMRVWDSDCITCSVCGGKSVGLLEDNKLNYCPHCGARMKGGD